jgi:hypothetical protein
MVRVMRDQTTAGGAAVRAAEPIEVIQDRLYAVGGTVTLDEKVTWGPGDGSLQPVLAYLALGAEVPTLIDAGLKVHEAAIAEQLGSLLPAGSRISVFLTRAEYDCFGGLAAVADQYQIERIYTGGTQNPFDAFGEVTGFTASWDQRVQLGRQPPGHSEVLEAAGGLEVLTPALRILATHWAYLPRLKTLFTSDLFGHTSLPTPGSSWVIDGDGDDDTTPESLAGHLTARYFWLADANTSAMQDNLRSIFETHEIEVIAPTHGRVIRGTVAVRRHYELLQRVLARVGVDRRRSA